ncbi:MAG: response regulator [Candidatus Portnoybacteria bacterium CG10_big_fil_rev_8_21_14_0_10_36_7]|uniref:Response regulator n=1 Tax=Candidatus Portnoybacteria bacterium CG10_big_fil_rev_8_21_14_0_10_36_7 TaxID=1974812 RepID=A0A2M8KED1_9BACT|nr:MAG: response regulator [Candidatus Portnoybacteria bacterium CG10_big_fil_rev_8_21_14_0_10_36_7]
MADEKTQTIKKILIVEDETYIRDLYVQILLKEGYLVDSASDGEEAYVKISKKEYDLILLDIILPKIDGLQVLEKLKKESIKISAPVVLLTNLSQEVVVAKAVDYGVRGYMVKSDLTPQDIINEVRGYLNGEHVRTQLK